MTTNDALMKKLDDFEKQIQEQTKQLERLISLFSINPCEETKEKLFGKQNITTF